MAVIVVGDIDRAARSLYVHGLYLCEHQEEDTGSAAILLSETIHRRVKMLEAFAERPMPPTA